MMGEGHLARIDSLIQRLQDAVTEVFGCDAQVQITLARRPSPAKPTPWNFPLIGGYHTTREVAELLHVSERLVRSLIDRGELRAERFGRTLRISDAALDDYRRRQNGADLTLLSRS